LVIGRPWRKLGGVLAEAVSSGPRITGAVVGIGLNVAQTPVPRSLVGRISSLEGESGRAVDRALVVVELLGFLRQVVDALHAGESGPLLERWRAFASRGFGRTVCWTDAVGVHRGIASDVDADGALVVAQGQAVSRLVAGEVAWEGLSGE
jgi:biotin-(acetyl-CoA carboxylase) ligase